MVPLKSTVTFIAVVAGLAQGSPAAIPTACGVIRPEFLLEYIHSGGESILGVSLLRFGVPVHLTQNGAQAQKRIA